jgi:hypothetical protein
MTSIEELKKEIDEIKTRNKRVESDKAWGKQAGLGKSLFWRLHT